MKNSATLIVICLVGLTTMVSAATRIKTTATGRVLCRFGGISHIMKEVTLRLIDEDGLFDNTVDRTTTGLDGRFTASGEAADFFGIPHVYITVFHKYSGIYGELEVDGLFGISRFHRTPLKKVAETLDFGDIIISDDHCRAYVQFYAAMSDYFVRTSGAPLPYETLHVFTHAIIHGGTPYALTSAVNVPEDYPLSFETAKHELAHTIRHTLDGSFNHLAYDAVRFNYFRSHNCGSKTNEGFAFNEGWAEFWAGSCQGPVFFGNSATNYKIEGNVANGLRRLQTTKGLSDLQMVDVLKGRNGTIHSFDDYEKALLSEINNK